MARKRPHIIADIVKEVEATAKKIRADLRRMGKDAQLGPGLARLTADLRKGATHVGKQIEHYARELKAEAKVARAKAGKAVGKRPAGKKRAAAKKTTRKRTAKKRG